MSSLLYYEASTKFREWNEGRQIKTVYRRDAAVEQLRMAGFARLDLPPFVP